MKEDFLFQNKRIACGAFAALGYHAYKSLNCKTLKSFIGFSFGLQEILFLFLLVNRKIYPNGTGI